MAFFVQLAVALVLDVIAYALMPKSSQKTTPQTLENPTADAGREVPILFGEILMKSANCLWFGDKSQQSYTISA